VLKQFSLDEDGSALNRFKTIMDGAFNTFREALGIKAARAEEAERGHVKGFCLEEDLYGVIAQMGRQFGRSSFALRPKGAQSEPAFPAVQDFPPVPSLRGR
jgi:hypothetical protein